MTPAVLPYLTLISLLATMFSAVGALALHDFSLHELEEYCRKKKRPALFGEIHDRHDNVVLGVRTFKVLATTMLIVTGFWWLFAPSHAGDTLTFGRLAAGVAVGAIVLLIATVWLPWSVSRLWSAPFLYHTWRFWLVLGMAFFPLGAGAHVVDGLLRRLAGRTADETSEEEAFEDEIRAMVTEGLRDGHLEPDAREMIEGVIELGDADVAEVMTPRSRMDVMSVGLSWREAMEFVIRVARTRIPVFEQSLDHVIGILYVKDLLPELTKPETDRRPLRDIVREAWFVPTTMPVDDLLQEFLDTHSHMAVAVDEYQAVAGLVTIEDVLEEIVGEIVDEHDMEDEEEILLIDDDTAEVSADAHLDEINEELGLELPESDEFDTIGGLVLSRLGRIPKPDEQIELAGVRITVIDASRRRIERVRIESGNGNSRNRE